MKDVSSQLNFKHRNIYSSGILKALYDAAKEGHFCIIPHNITERDILVYYHIC